MGQKKRYFFIIKNISEKELFSQQLEFMSSKDVKKNEPFELSEEIIYNYRVTFFYNFFEGFSFKEKIIKKEEFSLIDTNNEIIFLIKSQLNIAIDELLINYQDPYYKWCKSHNLPPRSTPTDTPEQKFIREHVIKRFTLRRYKEEEFYTTMLYGSYDLKKLSLLMEIYESIEAIVKMYEEDDKMIFKLYFEYIDTLF